MLDDLRKNQKGIIWAIAIVFVLSMAGVGFLEVFSERPFVGRIYGKKIYLEEFDNEYRENLRNHFNQNQEVNFDEQTQRQILDQTWSQYTYRRVMDRQLKRYRIRVTNKDIEHAVFVDPPEGVRVIDAFHVNGVFDFNTYLTFLANDEYFAENLELWLRQTIPYEKLERKIKDQVVVTADTVRADWIENNDRISARVIFFDWNSVEEQEISEEDIAAHYNKNRNDYRIEARRRYRYVSLPLEPSEDDKIRVLEDMNYVYGLLRTGSDFGELAELYSQDPGSAANRGSLGYFGRGRMVTEFENIAFNMEIGEISEPFESQFGYHIILLTDRRETETGEIELEASHILMRVEPSDRTRNDLRNRADDLYERAEVIGLERAAEEFGLVSAETSEFFRETEFIPGMGRFPHLVAEAFSRRLGFLVEPFDVQNGAVMVAELSFREAAHIQDLEQVSEVIRRELDRERRTVIAIEQANNFKNSFTEEEYFEMAEEQGLRILELSSRLITQTIPGLGNDRALNDELFKYETDQWTAIINTERGSFFAHITERQHPDMQDFENNIERLTTELRERKEREHYAEWVNRIMEEANIEDLRYMYYHF